MIDSFMKTLTGPCMIREGESLLACCSGGMDSMVLLDLLVHSSSPLKMRLGVVHVDHGIRGEVSVNDASFVRGYCEKLGLPCHVYQLGMSSKEPNLEERARLGRYEKIFACMAEFGYGAAATGHTKDDQAETLIYRFIRGSGIRGLGGMEYRSRNNLIKPVLSFTREQIESYAAERGIPFVEDQTNLDITLARNRIRREIIPSMKKINASVVEAISRLADIAREEGGFIDNEASALEGSSRMLDWGIVKAYRLADLQNAPRAVLKRMLIAIVSEMLDEPRGIDSIQVDGIMDVVEGRKAAHAMKRKVSACRDGDIMVFCTAGSGPFYDIAVTEPGVYMIEPLRLQVRIDFDPKPGLFLHVKSHMNGDRLQGKRVVKMLADKGIIKSLRQFWPVLVSGQEVLSVAGMRGSGEGMDIETEFPYHDPAKKGFSFSLKRNID